MADPHREEIAKLETLYANNPEGRVFTHLAEAYRKSGELDRAREILEEGLRRHSDYSSAHVVLGRVLTDMGQTDGATDAFRRVLELDRHNLVALRSLGEIANGAGRTEDALQYYRELLSLDPSDDRLRTSVRTLEERLEAERAPPPPVETAEPAAAGFGEADAMAGQEAGPAPHFEGGPGAEPDAGGEAESVPVEGLETGGAVPGLMAGWPSAEAEEQAAAEAGAERSQNWEEDVGIELDALPGDLGAFAGEGTDPGTASESGDLEWSATSRWVEDTAPFELPGGDLTLDEEPTLAVPEDVTAGQEEAPAAEAAFGQVGDGIEAAEREAPGEPERTPLEGIDLGLRPAADADESEPAGAAESWMPLEAAGAESFESAAPPPDAVPEPEDFYVPEPQPAPGGGEALVTETMAELYFAQGFYDRAAEVYRSLLAQRPGEARLTARLEEAEAMAAPPPAAHEAASQEAGEGWLEGVESAWTGGGGVAGGETTPYAWAEPGSDEEPVGPAVGDYFRALLSWRPGTATAAAPEPPVGEAWAAAGTEAPAGVEVDEEPVAELELMPEMETAEEDAVGPWGGSSVQPPELPEAASAAGTADEAPNEDEDLEMFRSWLQSLKK